MKKFFEKNELLKIAGSFALFTALLTWLFKTGGWNGTAFEAIEYQRVGIFDLSNHLVLGLYYFSIVITFLFVLGGFYSVLSKTKGYQKLTDEVAELFKDYELVFLGLTSFIIAILTAMLIDYYVVLIFIPFFITILSKMKINKYNTLAATFGSMMVGFTGSIYSLKVTGMDVGGDFSEHIYVRIALFALAFIIYNLFNYLFYKDKVKQRKKDYASDLFKTKVITKEKKNVWTYIILGLFTLTLLLAFMPWINVFGIEVFNNATTAIMEYNINEVYVFRFLLGNVEPFGQWDLYQAQVLMLITSLLIMFATKMEFDEYLNSFAEGFTKVSKLVVLMLAAFLILEIAVMHPVVPTIAHTFMKITSKFSPLFGTISAFIASMFTGEYQYLVSLIGDYFTNAYSTVADAIQIMFQSTFGLAALITPASGLLLVGLNYLDVEYKEWMKYIYKYVIVMFVIVILITALVINDFNILESLKNII